MDIKATIQFTDKQTVIELPELGKLILTKANKLKLDQPAVVVWSKDQIVFAIEKIEEKAEEKEGERAVAIFPPEEIELSYLSEKLTQIAEENGVKLTKRDTPAKIPSNHEKLVMNYLDTILVVLDSFGVTLKPKPKKKPAKAQHRWSKAVSEKEFYVEAYEAKATVIWQKRNEMLIKAGAVMKPVAPLNKDGSVGMSARFGEKIRSEHADKFKNFVTTEDIILKSVNEVGLFLYFAGTNSWLELKDAEGKTIDEWTVVK
ncbi:hypothetical protein [Enterococcus sp. JM9B]|uniref:hypothetical protein n=1 Tax=Enterococcus sp. JM9B TaxID=1857216 RepID=UPI001374EF01|nr:hypothetical protein [Enterococcus sp. JM9B]KAF1301816.1 hypothetical protein BAU16_07980 [Enterococcus sp. JM9B]